jgi:hypothetical protein
MELLIRNPARSAMLPGLGVVVICHLLNTKRLCVCFCFSSLHCHTLTAMGTSERLPEFRSTLRQVLKEVMRCCACPRAANAPASASGILPKASPAPPCLPQLSQVSLFPNFESDGFEIDRYGISTVATLLSLTSHLHSACNESGLSLLPATRLSQLDLYEPYTNHVTLQQRRVRYETLPEHLMDVASRRASFSTARDEPSLRPTSSTLKTRRPAPFASSESQTTIAIGASLPSKPSLKRATRSEDLRRNSSGTSLASRSTIQINSEIFDTPAPTHSSLHSSRSTTSIHSVKHFRSFCVLDTFVSGCPVTATSEDLRYIFQIGDQFTLDDQVRNETSIDIVIGSSLGGDEVIHLVLFSPLLSPSTGRSRFMLAALIDITHFVHEASQLPDLDTVSRESSSEDAVVMPAITPPQSSWSTRSCELLPEGLLGGCSVTAKPAKHPANKRYVSQRRPNSGPKVTGRESEDIWLSLAREELLQKDSQVPAGSATKESLVSKTSESLRTESSNGSKSSTAVDEALDVFMSSLQQLYSDSFLLARSPLDDKYYEICNVSPAVYASGEYISGHLTHTAPNVIESMSQKLGAATPFIITIRWGSHGIEKRLYCVPLYGQSSRIWICVLVDVHLLDLW